MEIGDWRMRSLLLLLLINVGCAMSEMKERDTFISFRKSAVVEDKSHQGLSVELIKQGSVFSKEGISS